MTIETDICVASLAGLARKQTGFLSFMNLGRSLLDFHWVIL